MDHIIFHSSTGGLGFSSSLDHSCPLKFQHCGFHHGFIFCWWITLVSSPISPRSFIIILRFLISHKAQRWSSSDNCCMASELYRSTSKQFLKEPLNTHLGLVAKTVLIALPARVIYLSVLGPSFFFPGKVQVSSEFESLVTAVTGMAQEPQGCWLEVSGAWLRWAGGSAALGTAWGRHNSSTSPVGRGRARSGRAGSSEASVL